MTDEEYLWEPVPDGWSVRRRADGPGPRATLLAGAADGDWGRDAASYPHPWPPPFTTIAWRLSHLSEMLTLRADHTAGGHSLTRDAHLVGGDAAAAVAAFDAGVTAWRKALLTSGDAALDTVGSTAPRPRSHCCATCTARDSPDRAAAGHGVGTSPSCWARRTVLMRSRVPSLR
ncbi:hypothetical protein [Streptomyces sp. NRRL S-646]|uniref:hypothetical protein n=1 Tax=Streptomyces sp. NRRL S-646 TaxID=1463917 RepID=UPI001F17805B|nr:hypothetical protein [Streptomyces sp. NRRL S-646]